MNRYNVYLLFAGLIVFFILICSVPSESSYYIPFRQSITADGESVLILENHNSAVHSSSSKIGEIACRYLDVPYVYGGSTAAGFDCSGFTQFVYREAGINLPRTSDAQMEFIVASGGLIGYDFNSLPVNALLFKAGKGEGGHVAIYLGNNEIIEAAGRGGGYKVVKVKLNPEQMAARFNLWGLPSGAENL